MRHEDVVFRTPDPVLAPRLHAMLHAVGLDVAYHRAVGDELFMRGEDGDETAVLDLVGGYGSLLLGHHHPALVAELTRFVAAGQPVHAQGSLRPVSQRLAAALDERAGGGHHAVLASSGAEAVEAALKHAMLGTGGRTFIALEGSFHGKTLGAVQLAGDADHRTPFDMAPAAAVHVRLNDVDHLEAVFAAVDAPAGFIFEPVQGEGGVRSISRPFARRAAALCRERGIPMIADECQTGIGRTGRFLACEHLAVRPDYVVLSKALGGGLVKIAALLVRREQYRPAFDLKHTSTFAGDELSSAVALKVLELTNEPLLAGVRERGERWLDALRDLARRYPDVIADVRGQGLMLALQLRPLTRSDSFTLRLFSTTSDLALLAAGYLLHVHRVRVAPTLGSATTLRLQPSANVAPLHLDRAMQALETLCICLRQADAPALTAHLSRGGTSAIAPSKPLREQLTVCTYQPGLIRHQSPSPIARVAWLCHLIDDADMVSLESAYGRCDATARNHLLDRLSPLASPVVMSEVDVRSATGQVVRLYPIMLPVTSAWMKRCLDLDMPDVAGALVQKGVDLAQRLGCRLTSLGQYTSIVTRGGRRLRTDGMGLTTGNAYSLALALEAIGEAERQRGIDPSQATWAVMGAAGSIGQAAARLLARRYRRTLLLGSPGTRSTSRLARLSRGLPGGQVIDDPASLGRAAVVLAATSAVNPPIDPAQLAPDAVVCDLSVPAAVSDELPLLRPDVTLIKGGIVRLPFEEDLHIVGFPLPTGRTYGCMGEALLLGLEQRTDRSLTGIVRAGNVQLLAGLAERHGFALDRYKDHCVLGTQAREVTHAGSISRAEPREEGGAEGGGACGTAGRRLSRAAV